MPPISPSPALTPPLPPVFSAYADSLAAGPVSNPGYHTRLPADGIAHHTRDNARLAVTLLDDGTPAGHARAQRILAALVLAQDTDPASVSYGAWPWYFEEPLAAMQPPDLNWADFIGATLLTLLHRHDARLPAPLVSCLHDAIDHAAAAIRRRDVGPGYTNICLMGAGVALAAGERRSRDDLVVYGRDRLRRLLDHTRHHGGLGEYNSPTYTTIALEETERILHLVRDPAARETAEVLFEMVWAEIAAFFHAPTRQWAGPHSRSYHDRLSPAIAADLAARLGFTLTAAPAAPPPLPLGARPCPARFRASFRRLPASPYRHRQTFARRADGTAAVVGTVWMDETASLGTASFDTLWQQRRPLLAYWRQGDDAVAVLRLRLLRDDDDWASGALFTAQLDNLVLAVIGTVRDGGDRHLMLDRPADGAFPTRRLAAQWSLDATAPAVQALGPETWMLAAGDTAAIVRGGPAHHAEVAATWQRTERPALGVAAAWSFAPGTSLRPSSQRLRIATAVRLGRRDELTPPPPIEQVDAETWRCGPLTVRVPTTDPGRDGA